MTWSGSWDKQQSVRRIEVQQSSTPFKDEPGLQSLAVLYVTRAEAGAIRELTRQLENARGRTDMISFMVTMGNPPLRAPGPATSDRPSNGYAAPYLALGTLFASEELPAAWRVDFSPQDGRYLLFDGERIRAEVRRLPNPDNRWIIDRLTETVDLAKSEPELTKPVGDAARFAGIDFME